MKLRQFRVRGFRCIHDTGAVTVSHATTLIGKNESGKTAILVALTHLNKDQPFDDRELCDELIDQLEDSDRIVEGTFELSEEEQQLMQQELPGISRLANVVVYRTKSAKEIQYEFPGARFPEKLSLNEEAVSGFTESLADLKAVIVPQIAAMQAAPSPSPDTEGNQQVQSPEQSSKQAQIAEAWTGAIEFFQNAPSFDFRTAEPQFKKMHEVVAPIAKKSKNPTIQAAVDKFKKAYNNLFVQDDYQARSAHFFAEKLHPRLLYFPDYKVIDGIIDVQAYIQGSQQVQKRSDTGYQFDKVETVRNLFHLASLDPSKLAESAKSPPRLASDLRRCSNRLSEMLSLTWKSKKIDVTLHYTDGTVTVQVGDIYPDGIAQNIGLLDRRSAGFKWHFSFYVNFRASVQQSAFKNAILLLDEPGLSLHPEQQAGLIEVIRSLAESNQVLYSTHSPFMIHDFSIGSLLTVEFDPLTKASKIQTNFWDGDWQTIRPVLHSIGDRMLLRFFRGAESLPVLLLVEGTTDERYLIAMSSIAEESDKMPAPLAGAEPIPFGGDTIVKERALHYYLSRKRKVIAMFDHEPGALAQAQELKQKNFPDEFIIVLDRVNDSDTDIEDLFAEVDYLNAVNAYYGRKLRTAGSWRNIDSLTLKKHRDLSPENKRITKALEHLFESHVGWGRFDKTGVCERLCETIATGGVSKESRKRFDQLFKRIAEACNKISGVDIKKK